VWIKVGWLLSMARSGTSIACYAGAAPWGHPVCDEPFGPWDRTTPPFNHPPVQTALMEAFEKSGRTLSPEVVELTKKLFSTMGTRTGSLICKVPHLHPTPAEIDEHLPRSKRVMLIRNPLHRLNSLYTRGWTESAGQEYDLNRYMAFAERWLAEPRDNRLVYDDIRDDPEGFFRKMYVAWDWMFEDEDVRAAADYARNNYHHRSKRVDAKADPSRVVSETKPALPEEAVAAYLGDPFIRDLMEQLGWSTNAEEYLRPGVGADAG
jgi:hypothetical protein